MSTESLENEDHKMKKKLFVLLTMIMVLSMVSISACTTTAEDENAEGVWSYEPAGPPLENIVGPHTFLTISNAGDWIGTITGHADDFGEVAIHSSGPWYYFGTVPFESANVDDKTGGLVISVFGSRLNAGTDWEGTWEITSGTGDLAGLQGQGTWEGPGWQGDPEVPGEVNYSGSIHFESE